MLITNCNTNVNTTSDTSFSTLSSTFPSTLSSNSPRPTACPPLYPTSCISPITTSDDPSYTQPIDNRMSNGIDWVDCLSNHPDYKGIDISLIQRQVELEGLMRAKGLLREEAKVLKAKEKHMESQTSYGHTLLSNYVHRLSMVVSEQLVAVREGKPGYTNNNFRLIKDLEPDVIAFIALKTVIDRICTKPSLQELGRLIGVNLETECRCRFFEEKAKSAFKLAMHKEKDRTQTFRKRHAIFSMMNAVVEGRYSGTPNPELAWSKWGGSSQLGIGTKLIQMVVSITGLVSVEMGIHRTNKGQQLYYVRPKPELKAWIEDWTSRSGILAPLCLPCIIPPKPYTTPFDGGYHTGLVKRIPLIKTYDPGYSDTISKPENIRRMSPVYEAVNIAQSTAWRVNTKVLHVLKTLWEEGIIVDCLPSREDSPPPVCPKCLQVVGDNHACFQEDKETLRLWKRHASITHASNASAFSKRFAIHRLLWVAERYKDDPALYFPYQLDFRGRLYAVPQVLNPQGADPAKGLLLFSYPKPIQSKEAADWLAIHVANTYGNDKLSFEDRIRWTEDNTPMITAIAENPIENRAMWSSTDSPFCFLAACFEWAGFKKQGYGYMSSLPVAQDGTCSGLQHYSALLRDHVGGAAVNLVPSDKPQDIYRVVADKVIERLEEMTLENSSVEDYELAQEWLCSGLITRKATKRAVMTLPYGSTLFSAKQYIRDYVEEMREKNPELIPWTLVRDTVSVEEYNRIAYEEGVEAAQEHSNPTGRACSWLGNIVWSCIHSTVIAASEAMSWLQKVTNVVSKGENLPMSWITPSGFIVLQRYNTTKARRVKTTLSGELVYKTDTDDRRTPKGSIETSFQDTATDSPPITVYLTLKEETDQLDPKGQRQGIAPNFIHSLDASALVFAVLYANKRYGIDSFALIHDSFGTHAGGEGCGDSARLAKAIRESFVDMYESHDVIAEFEEQVLSCLQNNRLRQGKTDPMPLDTLPERPAKGSLDLSKVLDSRYFFS